MPVSELAEMLRHWLGRFGRPTQFAEMAEHEQAVDTRLTTLERRQRDIAARLRLLEIQSDPRGIGRDS